MEDKDLESLVWIHVAGEVGPTYAGYVVRDRAAKDAKPWAPTPRPKHPPQWLFWFSLGWGIFASYLVGQMAPHMITGTVVASYCFWYWVWRNA